MLHPTSLPSLSGIGNVGEAARDFSSWLFDTGSRIWQILPLGPTGHGNSPYNSSSSFAGNPLLISLLELCTEGWLEEDEIQSSTSLNGPRVDYPNVVAHHDRRLRHAWHRIQQAAPKEKLEAIATWSTAVHQSSWLDDWLLFAALKDHFGQTSWSEWPEEFRQRRDVALARARIELASEIEFHRFVQYEFYRQWSSTRSLTTTLGIEIFGDLPFYPAYDSADVWANQELFQLDSGGLPKVVAGVPPDYFRPTGQHWGNPLYRWDHLADDEYGWWIDRIAAQLRLFDRVRIDHFRGFSAYWEVDRGETTAEAGRWCPGPGQKLFDTLEAHFGELPLMAEDLGLITDEVVELRRALGLPGMKVLQFGFDDEDSDHLPHRVDRDTIYYTGTHDNDTAVGWFDKASKTTRERFIDYSGGSAETVHWDLIRLAMASIADLAVVPMQDLLGLNSEARMNTPGSPSGNWEWRLDSSELDTAPGSRFRRLAEVTGRQPQTESETDTSSRDSNS